MGQPGIASPLPKYKPARGVHAENLVGVETAELADGAREARDGHRLASAGLPLVPAWKNRLKSEARPRLGHRAYQTGHLPSANRRRDAVFADDGLHPARMRVPRRFAAPSRSPAHDEAVSRHVGIGVDLADVKMLINQRSVITSTSATALGTQSHASDPRVPRTTPICCCLHRICGFP
jgi:hypothetical protein